MESIFRVPEHDVRVRDFESPCVPLGVVLEVPVSMGARVWVVLGASVSMGCVLIPAAGFLLAGSAGFVPTFVPSVPRLVPPPIDSSVSELPFGVPRVEIRVALPRGGCTIVTAVLSSRARKLAGSDSRGVCAGSPGRELAAAGLQATGGPGCPSEGLAPSPRY